MINPIDQSGDGDTPLNVDEELSKLKSAVDAKTNHVNHQMRLKIQAKSKKARKKRR